MQHRHIYLARRAPGSLAWDIVEQQTSSPDAEPSWEVLSGGSPSLAKLLPESLALYQSRLADAWTMTSRSLPELQECQLPSEFDVLEDGPPLQWAIDLLECMLPGRAIEVLAPEQDTAGVWSLLHRLAPANRHIVPRALIWGGTRSRFKPVTLGVQIACHFAEANRVPNDLDTDFLQTSERLARIEGDRRSVGTEEIELWVRPRWRLADLVELPKPIVRYEAPKRVLSPRDAEVARLRKIKKDRAERAAREPGAP